MKAIQRIFFIKFRKAYHVLTLLEDISSFMFAMLILMRKLKSLVRTVAVFIQDGTQPFRKHINSDGSLEIVIANFGTDNIQ